jgi:cytochrome c-type biogenesis protein CcmE
MSRIDDELEQAVRDADAAHPERSLPTAGDDGAGSAQASATDEARPVVADAQRRAPAVEAAQAPGKMRWGLLGALLALMGGILAIVFAGGQEAVAYSYRVDEIKAQGAQFGDRLVRVQGALVAGSLVRRDSPCEYRFMMRTLHEKTGEALEVRYPLCIVPDTFRDKEGVEVTAEGRLAADGHLQASKIFAKCPSKYDPSTHEMGDKSSSQRAQPEGTGSAVASSGQSAAREAEFAPTRVEASAGIR